MLAIAGTVRLDGRAGTVRVTGPVLLAVGGVLLARASLTPSWAAWPLAAGLVLLLPQFFAPPALRIAHGVLLAVGAVVVAVTLRREQPRRAS